MLLGEGRVGKTSTVLRYVHDKFDDRTQATIQASFLNKRISVAGENVNIAIWVSAPTAPQSASSSASACRLTAAEYQINGRTRQARSDSMH